MYTRANKNNKDSLTSKSKKENTPNTSTFQFQDNRTEGTPIQRKENNTGLPDNLKSGIESLSGYSMNDVRVHYNSNKPAQLQAHAYAQGSDIHLGPGQEKHLPHEAWHVVQQKQGRVQPTTQLKGKVNINDDDRLEREADIMGAKALQTKADESNQDLSSISNTPSVIQGKFGFEVETKLMLTAAPPNADISDKDSFDAPDIYLTDYPLVAKGNGFNIHVDHNTAFSREVKKGPIAEMVTEPAIDESTLTEEQAVNITKRMATAAKSMSASPSTPSKLSGHSEINSVEAKYSDIYVGYPNASGQSDYGYVQATFGVKLAAIPKMFTHMAKKEMAMSSKAAKVFKATVTDASNLTNKLKVVYKQVLNTGQDFGISDAWTTHHSDDYNKDFYYHKESNTSQWDKPSYDEQVDQDFKQLEGFLALVLQYLIAGRDFTRGEVSTNLLKNAIGQFFYKTKLSTIAKSMNGWSKKILDDDQWRAYVKKEILKECNRGADENMSKALEEIGSDTVKVGVWLDNVLSGTDDDIFTKGKNPYSKEIVDTVGPSDNKAPSAVLENRRVTPLGGPIKSGLGISPQKAKGWMKPDEWPELTRYYYSVVSALNEIDPQTPPDNIAPDTDE